MKSCADIKYRYLYVLDDFLILALEFQRQLERLNS